MSYKTKAVAEKRISEHASAVLKDAFPGILRIKGKTQLISEIRTISSKQLPGLSPSPVHRPVDLQMTL